MCRRGPHCPPLGRPHVSSRPITAGLWAVGTPLPFPLPQFSSALPVDPAPDCIWPRLPDPCAPATSWLSSSPPGLLSSSLRHPPRLQTAARVVFLQTPCDRVTPQGRSSVAPSWPEDEAQTQALGATVLPSTRTPRELELSRCLSLACRGLQSVLRAWCILRASEDGASAFWRQAQVTRHGLVSPPEGSSAAGGRRRGEGGSSADSRAPALLFRACFPRLPQPERPALRLALPLSSCLV